MLATQPNKKATSFVFPVEVDSQRKSSLSRNKQNMCRTVNSKELGSMLKGAFSDQLQCSQRISASVKSNMVFSPKSSSNLKENVSVTRSHRGSVMIQPCAINRINTNLGKLCKQLDIEDSLEEQNLASINSANIKINVASDFRNQT